MPGYFCLELRLVVQRIQLRGAIQIEIGIDKFPSHRVQAETGAEEGARKASSRRKALPAVRSAWSGVRPAYCFAFSSRASGSDIVVLTALRITTGHASASGGDAGAYCAVIEAVSAA